jgi:peptidoglycan-associated lipoprotein
MDKIVAFALPVLIGLAGCAHQAEHKPAATAATQPAATQPSSDSSASASNAGTCARDLDCAEGQLCVDGRCVSISDNLSLCTKVSVHFAFNDSGIPDSEKNGLERAARCLKADHALKLSIGGNADERGTEEYNLALADKRAHSVAEYLRALGASEAQLKTISYGKENPICQEHDEACWAQNRRADLAAAGAQKRHK